MGFDSFTKYGVRTDKCEYAFFIVEPTNISVMSQASIDTKIYHLRMLLSIVPDLEVIAMDNCECFDSNKLYVRKQKYHIPHGIAVTGIQTSILTVCISCSTMSKHFKRGDHY